MKVFLRTATICIVIAFAYTRAGYSRDNNIISAELDSIIQNCLPEGTDISVYVWDLDGDSAMYAYRENVLNRPASTMKLLTSYSALKSLGSDYSFQTTLKTDGILENDGTLSGNLYLVGGLDPQLMEADLHSLVSDMKNCGITRINGNILADVSIMDSIYWGSGWAWDDTPNSFQPYISPLIVHGGYIGISVIPGQKGLPPTVNTYPQSGYYKVVNLARTKDESLGMLSIKRDWLNNKNTITISGNATKATSTDLNIYDSDNFTLTLFSEYVGQEGIEFEGTGWGTCPAQSVTLASVRHTLREVLKEALKESVNLNAEAMFLQAARSKSHAQTNFNNAAKYTTRLLRLNVKRCPTFNIADGSGLSMYDYIPARLFVEVLRLFYQEPEMYEIIYESLPIAGYDGTLKGRMGGKTTSGRIHAKTGTVTGACTLSGYARDADGRNMAFCIMNSGAIKMAASRRVQDAICNILCQ